MPGTRQTRAGPRRARLGLSDAGRRLRRPPQSASCDPNDGAARTDVQEEEERIREWAGGAHRAARADARRSSRRPSSPGR